MCEAPRNSLRPDCRHVLCLGPRTILNVHTALALATPFLRSRQNQPAPRSTHARACAGSSRGCTGCIHGDPGKGYRDRAVSRPSRCPRSSRASSSRAITADDLGPQRACPLGVPPPYHTLPWLSRSPVRPARRNQAHARARYNRTQPYVHAHNLVICTPPLRVTYTLSPTSVLLRPPAQCRAIAPHHRFQVPQWPPALLCTC